MKSVVGRRPFWFYGSGYLRFRMIPDDQNVPGEREGDGVQQRHGEKGCAIEPAYSCLQNAVTPP
jgi:hypothetical protein